MTWKQANEAYRKRPQVAQLPVTHDDLTAGATNQSFDFSAALPTDAIVRAQWIDVIEQFASVGSATSAAKTFGETETYALTHGWTVLVAVDGGGEDTATFEFTAGTQECTTYFPVSDLVGLTLNVSTNDGANELVTFTSPCTSSAHVRAQIAAQTTGLAVSQAVTATAALIPTNTEDATYDMRATGVTVIIDVDDDGADTATWTAVRAVSEGSGLSIVDLDGDTLALSIDGAAVPDITFTVAAVDVDTAAAEINAQLIGGSAVVNGAEIDIYSDTYGTNSIVDITGGTGRAELGHAIAENTEATSDAADCKVTTIAEVKTWLEGDITGGSGITVTDLTNDRFSIISNTTGVDSELDVQASTALVTLGLSTGIVVGTADQPLLTSDKLGSISTISVVDVDSGLTWAAASDGGGDAVDSTVVTAAEVNQVLTDDIAGVTMSLDSGAPVMTSDSDGVGSILNFGTGTANTALGLANETITGVDAINGTATADLGISGGDVDAQLDGANISSATGIVNSPKGVAPNGHYGAETLALRIDSNVNVNLLIAGSCIAYCEYTDQTNYL